MSTYVGRLSAGLEQNAAIGATLYGICTTAINTAAKVVTLDEFDRFMHGVSINVKFTKGNKVTSNVTLQVGNATACTVVGDCTCNAGEILSFTLDWTDIRGNVSINIADAKWIVSGHVIQSASDTPSAVSTNAALGESFKYAREDHVHNIVLAEGDEDGEVKIAGQNVPVHGLKSAAFTEIEDYATSEQGAKADNAMPKSGGTFTGEIILPATTDDSENLSAVTKAYVDSIVNDILGSANAMVFKGTIGAANANPRPTVIELPSGNLALGEEYQAGWTYRVVTAGEYAGQDCEVGDLIISIHDSDPNQASLNPTHWTVAQANVDGAVYKSSNSFTSGNVVIADGTNGQVATSQYTINKSVPADAVFTDHQYELTTGANAYTGSAALGANEQGLVLVEVEDGILYLKRGIKFTTTPVGTALAPASNND